MIAKIFMRARRLKRAAIPKNIIALILLDSSGNFAIILPTKVVGGGF